MKKKTIALLLALVLALGAVIGGTIAYFTDEEMVKNTFTVGDISITLDEADVSTADTTDRTEEGNAYHLQPGLEYTKDPTVTVVKDSENCYVRMLVTVEDLDDLKKAFPDSAYYKDGIFLLEKLVDWDRDCWKFAGFDPDTSTYEFRYKEVVEKDTAADTKLDPQFTTITIPGEIDNAHIAYLDNVDIKVEAHAIQAAGFETADAAWAQFKK